MEAIESCNFELARSIELQINNLKESQDMLCSEKSMNEAVLSYSIIKEKVQLNASKLFTVYHQKMFDIKKKFLGQKSSIEQQFAQKQTEISEKYAKDLELATTRTVVEADYLKKEAQVKAKYGYYDDADSILRESEEIRQSIIFQRQNEVHEQYKGLIFLLENQKDADTRNIDDNMKQSIEFLKIEYEKEIEVLKKTLSVSAAKLKIQRDMEADELIFDPLDNEEPLAISSRSISSIGSKPSPRRSPISSRGSPIRRK